MNKKILTQLAAAGAVLLGLAPGQAATTYGTLGDADFVINNSTTWTKAGSPYILNTITYVANGADLTIEPGVVIQGVPDSADGNSNNNNPGTLVISRGSKIFANGKPSEPIIFTSTLDEKVWTFNGTANSTWTSVNNNRTGLCGGVVLLGNTYVTATSASALATNPAGNNTDGGTVEGLTNASLGRYGGGSNMTANDNHDAGQMSFWSIRYAGEVIGAANEINGLTLAAVGRLTDIDHIEVFNALDDAVEFFGGTVNTKHMALINPGDDGIDWDMGFRGKGQYYFVVQGGNASASVGSGFSDKAGELDGSDSADQNVPFACPTFYNLTVIGMTPANVPGINTNFIGLYYRDGSAGRVFNSLILNERGGAVGIERAGTTVGPDGLVLGNCTAHLSQSYAALKAAGNLTAFYDHNTESANALAFDQVEIWNCGGVLFGTISGNTTGTDYNSGAVYTGSVTGFTDLGNSPSAQPIVALSQVNDFKTLPPNGNFSATTSVDPRAANSAVSGGKVPADPFFDNTGYKGAFAPNSNWMAGWTHAGEIGLVTFSNGTTTNIVGDRFAFEFTSVAGQWYLVQSSTDLSTWTTIDSVEATGATTVYLDDVDLKTKKFYRVIKL